MPKNFAGEPFSAALQKFPVAKKFLDKGGGGVSGFSVEYFLSHSAENLRRGIVYCCIDFGYRKSLWIIGEGGVSRFSVEIFLSHSAEKFRRGTLRCFRKFLVSKNFMLQRVMSRYSVENFLSYSTETLRRGTLRYCFSEKFRWRKSLCLSGGGRREYHDFLSKIFCLTVPKNFAGEPFSAALQKFPVAKKFMDKGGGVSRFSVENFLSHSAEKFRS